MSGRLDTSPPPGRADAGPSLAGGHGDEAIDRKASAGWTNDGERSSLWALRLMRWIAVSAGRPLARLALHPITLYFLLVNGRARRASLSFLGRALGRPASWRDAYRHIHCFASTILDRVYFLQERFEQFEVSARRPEIIHEPLERGEGVMLVGAHLGSFEALRASSHGRGVKVAMLMFEDNARLINATLAALAPSAPSMSSTPNLQSPPLCTIALGKPGTMLQLRRWLDEGGVAGLLADRTLPAQGADRGSRVDRSRLLWFDFLGQPARFSDGPFRLAAMLRRKVVFMAGLYRGGNRYELHFVELADFSADAAAEPHARPDAENSDANPLRANPLRASRAAQIDARVHEAMQRYVSLLETLCRESPYNWFNFFDFWACDAADRPVAH